MLVEDSPLKRKLPSVCDINATDRYLDYIFNALVAYF